MALVEQVGSVVLADRGLHAFAEGNGQTSRGTPPNASTLRHVYKLIRNALGDAYRMELVTRNVATQVKAPPIDRQRRVGLDVAEAERCSR